MNSYRLRSTMRPMVGAPVNWNARAVIWSGTDRRYWLRESVRRVAWLLRRNVSGRVDRSRRFRSGAWLLRCVDDRTSAHYTAAQRRIRHLLNTQADVEAREAWAATNRYWRARERMKAGTRD